MTWKVEYLTSFKKDVQKLDPQIQRRIRDFLEKRVLALDNPRAIGETLKGAKLGDYWKYRVGDYRIICDIQDHTLTILALMVGNRCEVYR
jgi:mRNA interferase RelE/StbE